MTDEPNEPQPEDFSTFEAKAKEPDAEPRKDDDPPQVNDKDDTLELGGDDAPKVEDDDDKDGKTRSRHPSQRIAHYRYIAGEAERERDEARQELAAIKGGGQRPTDTTVEAIKAREPKFDDKNPDGSDKYEFGEADPLYSEDRQDWKLDLREATKADATKAEQQKTAATREITGKLETGMANIEKTGPEKYTDFEEKIEGAIEARGGEPLHPMVSIGIAVSPAGADIAYRLATDEAAATKIETLAKTNPRAAAMEFGELEGQYLDTEEDTDLDLNDPLDMARMIGRERARRKGLNKSAAVERKVTKAPEPAEHRSRGANGQFETREDTPNFAEFERMAKRAAAK